MKCISLWQPWASAIALGHKRIETRGWPTSHRGPIAIHAAMTERECRELRHYPEEYFARFEADGLVDLYQRGRMPFGALVAAASLAKVIPVEAAQPDRKEWLYGNYEFGRFAWCLEDVRALVQPIPYRGRQGLFDVPDELVRGGVA